jgi:N-acetylneuraminic acid mutarotase
MVRSNKRRFGTRAAALSAVVLVLPLLGPVLAAGPASAQLAGGFVATGSLNTARDHATATLLANGEVLVAGGLDAAGGALGSAELYNPADGSWTRTAPMPVAVTDASSIALANGEVLVAGGLTGSAGALVPTAASQLYNPSTGQWLLTTGTLQQATFEASAALLPSGEVLYAGGLPNTSTTATAAQTAELYDPTTGGWSLTSLLPVGVAGAQVAVLAGGDVLVAGGETGPSGAITDSAALYAPSSGAWSPVGPMPVGVAFGATTVLSDGAVLVAGGETTPTGAITAATQVFNPSTNSWQSAGGLPASTYGATATLLRSGEVLYAGGLTSATGGPSAAGELYDPSTGTWATTGSLLVAEGFGTATELGNGSVLVAGGQAATGPTPEAELYEPTSTTGAPTITSPSTFDVVAGSFNTFSITATGTPAPTITETGALPPGMSFVYNGNGKATVAGTPPAGTTGVFPVTVTASNGVGTAATQQLLITVAAPRVVVSPPKFTSSSRTLVLPGANAVVTVSASGSPAPTIAESGVLPAGMAFHYDGNGTATISGVTPPGSSGKYSITLTASNGASISASQVLQLAVGRPAVVETSYGAGYWYTTSGGDVIGQGSALPVAPQSEQHPSGVVAMATTPDHLGYYLASSSGGVYPYGDARWYGSIANRHLSAPTVAMAVTPSGGGYYLVTRAGNVFNFGDARWYGSTAGRHAPPIAAFALTPDGLGYWLVSIYGNIYGFGNARFEGSPADHLIPRVVAFAPTPDGHGYWVVTNKGNVFNYGDARWYGSLAQRHVPPVVAFAAAPSGQGYWVVTNKGNVFNYGNARWYGSSAGTALPGAVTAFAPEP